jgi:tetratricopeptide (TPR) repeat protein
MLTVAKELRAHGHREQSLEMARRLVQWLEARSQAEPPVGNRLLLLAEAHRLAEQWSESEALFSQMLAQDPDGVLSVYYLQRLGGVAARQGKRDQAVTISSRLAELDRPFLQGEHTVGRSFIAAELGDPAAAIDLLRAAFTEGIPYGIWIHQEVAFEPLRDDPDFQELMRPKG